MIGVANRLADDQPNTALILRSGLLAASRRMATSARGHPSRRRASARLLRMRAKNVPRLVLRPKSILCKMCACPSACAGTTRNVFRRHAKFPHSKFQTAKRLRSRAAARVGLLVDLPFLRGDGAPKRRALVVKNAPFGRSVAGFVAKGSFFRGLGCLAARRFPAARLSPSSHLSGSAPLVGPDEKPSASESALARHSRGRRIRPAWVTPPRPSSRSVPLQ